MDVLPRHLQLKLYKGIDTLRALGVQPGRLVVPDSLRAALDVCLRRCMHDEMDDDLYTDIPIANTAADRYRLIRPLGGKIEMCVYLHKTIAGVSKMDITTMVRGEDGRPIFKTSAFVIIPNVPPNVPL